MLSRLCCARFVPIILTGALEGKRAPAGCLYSNLLPEIQDGCILDLDADAATWLSI